MQYLLLFEKHLLKTTVPRKAVPRFMYGLGPLLQVTPPPLCFLPLLYCLTYQDTVGFGLFTGFVNNKNIKYM